jgi:hypothetical protein
MIRSLLVASTFALTSVAFAADTKQETGIGAKAPAPKLAGLDGKAVAFDDVRGKTATVVVFVSFECPVSNPIPTRSCSTTWRRRTRRRA